MPGTPTSGGPEATRAAHLAGSINIGLGGQYATWAGTILSREKPIVIIANPGAERESALRLGRIGFDHVVGHLEGGVASLKSRPDLTRKTDRAFAIFSGFLCQCAQVQM